MSVSSSGRTARSWKLEDTLTQETIERIRRDYVPRQVTHKQLAASA